MNSAVISRHSVLAAGRPLGSRESVEQLEFAPVELKWDREMHSDTSTRELVTIAWAEYEGHR